jgi:hypothetical protein
VYSALHLGDASTAVASRLCLAFRIWRRTSSTGRRLLRREGFEVLDLIELYAPDGEMRTPMAIPPAWAQRWPVEEVWRARRIEG